MPRDPHSERFDPGTAREAAFAAAVAPRYASVGTGPEPSLDLLSADGRRAIECKFALHGVRDLDAAVIQLALTLAAHPALERLTLVAFVGRISLVRVESEWTRVLAALRAELAERLALVAVGVDGGANVPGDDAELDWLAQRARSMGDPRRSQSLQSSHDAASGPWTEKAFDVWMVLLDAWLRREPALPIGEIAARSHCSYPTVAATVQHLEARGELSRTKSRRAGLASMPRGSLGEVLIMADHLRGTLRYVDGSGHRPDPEALLRRIRAKAPASVVIGGVVAARHYAPDFDLNGVPRLDVTAQTGTDPAWVTSLDPALRLATMQERSPVLVVHQSRRSRAMDDGKEGGIGSFASPAETLLDLYELRLTEQADDFVRSMRRKGDRHG